MTIETACVLNNVYNRYNVPRDVRKIIYNFIHPKIKHPEVMKELKRKTKKVRTQLDRVNNIGRPLDWSRFFAIIKDKKTEYKTWIIKKCWLSVDEYLFTFTEEDYGKLIYEADSDSD